MPNVNEEDKKKMTHDDAEVFSPVAKTVAKRKADNSKTQKMSREDMGKKVSVEEDVEDEFEDDDLEEGKTFRKDQDDDEYDKNSKMKNRRMKGRGKRSDDQDDEDDMKESVTESLMPNSETLETVVETIIEYATSQNEESLQESKKEIGTLFEGTDFSEDFKTKATTIFEAAVNERVSSISPFLKESLEASIKDMISETVEKMNNALDKYTDYVAENWVTDNKPALTNRVKMDQYESIVNSLVGVFNEHNISVLDEEDSVTDKLLERIEMLEDKNSKLTNDIIEKNDILEEFEKAAVLSELTEDLNLSDSDYDRLNGLTEHLSYEDRDEIQTIVENFFVKGSKKSINESKESVPLNEEVGDDTEKETLNESSSSLVDWFNSNL